MSASETWTLHGSGPLNGRLRVPGDKSVSHRSLLFGALARSDSHITGLLQSEDVAATRSAVEAMGVSVVADGDGLRLTPPNELVAPEHPIDCGNSGTSIRLLTGLMAGAQLGGVLTGDASLRKRPMRRIVDPLTEMGADVSGVDGRAPLTIRPSRLWAHAHDLAIASAQVKSCLMLAGLKHGVSVREPKQSRDHTERMLRAMGATLTDRDGWLVLDPVERLDAIDVDVPGDVSAAAFWLVAASIVPGSRVELARVGSNRTRTGVIDALLAMGADIEQAALASAGSEPMADLLVCHAPLAGARLDGELALRALDELPVLAVAAASAHGETVIADAEELRVKESDRIARVVLGLRACGVDVQETPDGMIIQGCGGPIPGGGEVDAHGDHRIAMAFAVAAHNSERPIRITGAESVRSSYPLFRAHLEHLHG